MDDDDLDELLDEVEKKFCSKVSAACSDEKRNKHENKQGEWSASKHEEPKSSVSEDIDALLEELLEDDYSSSPQSKSEPFSKREQAVKKLSFQTAGRKCCPVFIGGSSVPNGVGTATSQRSCDQLRCISCDFRVLMFDDSEWDASCDYLFLRNNVPDRQKLRDKLKKRKGLRAYACQCNWVSTSETTDLRDQPQLRWVCGKHLD
ncbi:cilia- and flagella-associated protein 418 [Girardinichthys multiradiatus]|uniref:cilia- and flagella-associated protein 418 n=1 Tax=Girardinichthys multiradiatus TaxID=208333 RepID=UPI001FAC81C8|nr:cilia- and flagella-associated protein 418 [Girardinichthys multiradiatus]